MGGPKARTSATDLRFCRNRACVATGSSSKPDGARSTTRSLTRATTESRKSRLLVDGGSIRRYFAKMYARPGRKLVGKVWYAGHRDRRLLRKVFSERNGAGVVACVKSTIEKGLEVKQKVKMVVEK